MDYCPHYASENEMTQNKSSEKIKMSKRHPAVGAKRFRIATLVLAVATAGAFKCHELW
jgi:hypothetical protein